MIMPHKPLKRRPRPPETAGFLRNACWWKFTPKALDNIDLGREFSSAPWVGVAPAWIFTRTGFDSVVSPR